MSEPDWINDKGKIIEPDFCQDFLASHPMVSVNDAFFTVDGRITDEAPLKKAIYDSIRMWSAESVAARKNI